jgi:predicted metal-binding protein
MKISESVFSELRAVAVAGGATQVKQIDPANVVVSQWVRSKCMHGCAMFGKRFTCPPYTPSVEETMAMLQSYHEALLIEFDGLSGQVLKSFTNASEVAFNLERAAFVAGFDKAFSFGAGFCTLCPECPAGKLAEPSIFSKKECLQPKKARPSMEAAGIDVYSTVRNCGSELKPVKDLKDSFKLFGLTLLG